MKIYIDGEAPLAGFLLEVVPVTERNLQAVGNGTLAEHMEKIHARSKQISNE